MTGCSVGLLEGRGRGGYEGSVVGLGGAAMTLVRDRWFQVFCRMGGGGEFDRGCLLIRETQQLSTQGKRGRIQWFFCCEFDGKEESICFWLGMKMQADTKDRSIFTVRVQLLLDCL